MSENTQFTQHSRKTSGDFKHRGILEKTTTNHRLKVEQAFTDNVQDWERNRDLAAAIKDYSLDNLADLLETFESRAIDNGCQVHWAEHTEDARDIIGSIAKKHGVRSTVKMKSMTTEEVDLNRFLERQGIDVYETDLGELIVQMRGEKPYHILTPAMHLNKADIAALFHELLGTPLDADAGSLTMAAREYLRARYLEADMSVTGANFLLAEDGGIVMVENEGNGRLCMACPPVQIVLVGIEKVLPSAKELPFFLPHLVTSATGQLLNTYTTVTSGPRREDEHDGPKEVHIILLDNGRSALLRSPTFRASLRCIRCGACLNACPVYKTIGGHAYTTTYPGPIGATITPHLEGFQRFQHLSQASSLCGACSDVCPVKIPLHGLIHENRIVADETKTSDASWRIALRWWAFLATSRRRMKLADRLYHASTSLQDKLLPDEIADRVPDLAPKSFEKLWRERER